MMESMYGKEFGQLENTAGKMPSTIVEVPDETDNREAGFSSISNVRSNDKPPKRPNLMDKLANEWETGAKKQPSAELFSAQNKFSLATNDQWGF